MPRTLTLECPRCKKPFKAPKHLKKPRKHRWENKTFWQATVVYCSLECMHD